MGFFSNLRKAVKAGSDFNPELEQTLGSLEELEHAGKLDGVLSVALKTYETEHEAYKAMGSHAGAADHQADSAAMKNFLATLGSNIEHLPAEVKPHAQKLIDLSDDMKKALGPLGNLF